MTYEETLAYLYERLPMFSRIGAAAYKPDLNNTIQLCAFLGNPERKFKSVHIAGTNGKGSVSHMLAAICQCAGLKTGLYTSPHLKDFRERIRIDGEMISKEFVVDFTERMEGQIDLLDPSFFELTVGMAFEYFASERVDIAIIETGLGGRLDSTNVVVPEVSVITNIGWDHMNLLGDTLEKIATEKAGIIKQGIPVVVGEYAVDTAAVFEKVAAHVSAEIIFASHRRQAAEFNWREGGLQVSVAEEGKTDHQVYHLDLQGIYQLKNLLTVLETVTQLRKRDWKIAEKHVLQGLSGVKELTGLHGRWEIMHRHPLLICDVGHNEAGIKQILEQLEVTEHRDLHIVIGLVKDKEVDKVLQLLPKTANYYFTHANIPRALPAEQLMHDAARYMLEGKSFGDVNVAINAAVERAEREDLILVCGSVFLVGEVDEGKWHFN